MLLRKCITPLLRMHTAAPLCDRFESRNPTRAHQYLFMPLWKRSPDSPCNASTHYIHVPGARKFVCHVCATAPCRDQKPEHHIINNCVVSAAGGVCNKNALFSMHRWACAGSIQQAVRRSQPYARHINHMFFESHTQHIGSAVSSRCTQNLSLRCRFICCMSTMPPPTLIAKRPTSVCFGNLPWQRRVDGMMGRMPCSTVRVLRTGRKTTTATAAVTTPTCDSRSHANGRGLISKVLSMNTNSER